MIDVSINPDLLILLRTLLFLAPLSLTLMLARRYKDQERVLVAALFSFLYNLGLLLPAHVAAMTLGLWSYGSDVLMIMGMPADIWFGGSLLFGPCLFLANPHRSPLLFPLLVLACNLLLFRSLDPFVMAGEYWAAGVLAIFLGVHIPGLFLARWTARETHLGKRAALLALGYGGLAYFVLPSLIMRAMGGEWGLQHKTVLAWALLGMALMPCVVLGLHAVQMFVLHGEGTPIPLDKTKALVRSGLYAYLTNPMQLSSALSWVVLGIFLQNFFVALAACMAVVFVQGLVRWHHRNDLNVRFPQGWPEYRQHVPDWRPSWQPWIKRDAMLYLDETIAVHHALASFIRRRNIRNIDIVPQTGSPVVYIDGTSGHAFSGMAALACCLFHVNCAIALAGAALFLFAMPTVAHAAVNCSTETTA